MGGSEESNFNGIMRKIIKKSLFTERQIEIILNRRGLLESSFGVSRGAYYRQLGQSRDKLVSFYYTAALLRGLGVVKASDEGGVISKLSEQIAVMQSGDVFPEREDEITAVIDKLIRQACGV